MQKPLLLNGALVALALGTFGVVWATRTAPTTGELLARKNQLLPELSQALVDGATFSKARETLELRRENGEFRIIKPWQERADVATINKWLSAADMATAERPADGVSAEQAGFGPNAYRVSIDVGGKQLKLTLGGPAPTPAGARYAKVESSAGELTSVVRGSVASELEVAFDSFREARFLEYGKRELKKLTLASPAGAIELEQREHAAFFVKVGDAWELARPDVIRTITQQLARLSSELFVEPEQARSALGSTALRLQLEPKDAAAGTVNIALGGQCPKDEKLALMLREQPGRAARAGCVDKALVASLTLERDTLRLRGPFAAEPDEIEELYITRGAQKLELARKDKAFVLRAPSKSDVPLNIGNQRISAILAAEGELVTGDEVGDGAGELRIQVAGGDEASHREERVLLGKPRPDKSVCFKRLADNVTRCVTDERAVDLEPDPRLLRSLSLLDFSPSELTSFSVETPELKERLLRRSDGSYELQQPKGYAHDAARVADAVQSLGTLEAQRWIAAYEEPGFGFGQPSMYVSVQLAASPEPRRLLVGAKLKGGYYARLSPDPAIFLLGGALYDLLAEPLIDRSLCPFSEAELDYVRFHPGVEKPRPAGGALLETLVALRASSVLHLGKARAGEGNFNAPELTLDYVARDHRNLRVAIGQCTPIHATRCYVRRDDVDATFTLDGELARTFRDLIRR